MDKLDKVLDGLDRCLKGKCSMCPYKHNGYSGMDCRIQSTRDVYELLKELKKDRLEIAHEMVSNSILMYQGKEIVRCKDCKHGEKSPTFRYYPEITWCNKHSTSHNDDWFCADGERT